MYLNPSDHTDDRERNVVVYMGGENDPALDAPYLEHIVIDFRSQEP